MFLFQRIEPLLPPNVEKVVPTPAQLAASPEVSPVSEEQQQNQVSHS